MAKESWRDNLPEVQAAIEALVARPSSSMLEPAPHDDLFAAARAIGGRALQELRELACKRTGMTMDQLLEAERNVGWPKDVIPTAPNPRVLSRRRMVAAAVPERYIRAVADEPPLEVDALKQVKRFLGSSATFIVLSGAKGTRKTGSASWALGQVDGGRFVDATKILSTKIEDKAEWGRICGSSAIVLDDLGTETHDTQGYFQEAFTDLFNGYYGGCTRLLMTCNRTSEEFRKLYGVRVYDRLREAGMWATIGGDSQRQTAQWAEREPGEEG